MYVSGESDSFIVPKKQANKDSGSLSAESVEGRRLTKENVEQLLLDRPQCRASRSRGLLGVREAALIQVRLWSSSSKVGAVCGTSARTDLCGGWPERAIPTASTVMAIWAVSLASHERGASIPGRDVEPFS